MVARWEGTVLSGRRHADGGGHHTRPDVPGGCPAGAVQARAALELRWRCAFFRDARWRALPDVATGRCAVSNPNDAQLGQRAHGPRLHEMNTFSAGWPVLEEASVNNQ